MLPSFVEAGCSKLTMSLVNNSLNFQIAISQIHVQCYCFVEKCENLTKQMCIRLYAWHILNELTS